MTKFPSGMKLPKLGQATIDGLKGFGSTDKYGVDWNAPKNGLEFIMTTYGHWGYRYPFSLLPADMNGIKNRILSGERAISKSELTKNIAAALDEESGAPYADYLMTGLKKVSSPLYAKTHHLLTSR